MCAFWCFIAKSWSSMWCVANGINRSFCHFRLFFPALSFLSRKNWLELYDKSQFGRGNKNANLKHSDDDLVLLFSYVNVYWQYNKNLSKMCVPSHWNNKHFLDDHSPAKHTQKTHNFFPTQTFFYFWRHLLVMQSWAWPPLFNSETKQVLPLTQISGVSFL